MKLLEILQKELNEFPEGMLYAVQDVDGVVKFGKHSQPTLYDCGMWQRHEDVICPEFARLELAEDWDSAIVTKDMWENDKVKSKTINTLQKGHVHADLMAQYAEDAKTTDKPWRLWQVKGADGEWLNLPCNPSFATQSEYRRKLKTHIVNGVEVPDLRINVFNKEDPYGNCIGYCADPLNAELYCNHYPVDTETTDRFLKLGILYENTEEGKQAAILHAKAWLGIV